MRRLNNIYADIISIENLELADAKARKGKRHQYAIKIHDQNKHENILKLHTMLKNKTYKTSEYTRFLVKDPKEREVFRLPYFPDRITHHAVMNKLEKVFVNSFTADTYSCIKGRGIHQAVKNLRRALADEQGTKYCLKLDIKKFYPSIDNGTLKTLLRKKFKDRDLLWLLDEIIDSAPGLPIGNYLSQYFANYYLSGLDHWIKEQLHVKYYFRYADDIVILSPYKEELHQLLFDIRNYLKNNLRLEIKDNYQVFPVYARGIDFLGYVFRHTHIRIRKRIKKNCFRMMNRKRSNASIASYRGWFRHGNAHTLEKKIFYEGLQ